MIKLMDMPVVTDSLAVAVPSDGVDVWMVVAIVEFAIIVVAILFAVRRAPRLDERLRAKKREARSGHVDFSNVLDSAFHSQELFDKLKVKCHPDRFPNDPEKNGIALELFQQISKNRNDVKALEALRKRAEEELGVKI